ncbi:MAG: NfeD family protein [Elusimicrobiota bacterium]|jgi:membrane protein implicated in regulation of membrane protease activity|nr:NfeD family protein [Elusimicrobiota bacterium]
MYWFILIFVFVIFEIATPGAFYSMCLALGALTAGIASLFGADRYLQYGIFAVISLVSIFAVRPIFLRAVKKMKGVQTNVDALIDQTAIVTEKITPQKCGFIKIGGEIWLAESESEIETGSEAIIKEVSGTKVKVVVKQDA